MLKKILVLLILIAGAYVGYQKYQSMSNELVSMKSLIDSVATGPVSGELAARAFKNSMIQMCKINGADERNGFGTIDECVQLLNSTVHAECLEKLDFAASQKYTSIQALQSDFKKYFTCAAKRLSRS